MAGANQKALCLLADAAGEYFSIWPDPESPDPMLVIEKDGFALVNLTSTQQSYNGTASTMREGTFHTTGSGTFGNLVKADEQRLRIHAGGDASLVMTATAGTVVLLHPLPL